MSVRLIKNTSVLWKDGRAAPLLLVIWTYSTFIAGLCIIRMWVLEYPQAPGFFEVGLVYGGTLKRDL